MVLYARDIVETDFLTLPPESSTLQAAKEMAKRHHGFVIVGVTPGNPVGIVTEWDLLAKVVAEGRDPADVRLQDIMTETLVSVDSKESIDRVAQIMSEKGTRRVLVVDRGNIIGVIRVQTILARMRDFINSISAQIARSQAPLF